MAIAEKSIHFGGNFKDDTSRYHTTQTQTCFTHHQHILSLIYFKKNPHNLKEFWQLFCKCIESVLLLLMRIEFEISWCGFRTMKSVRSVRRAERMWMCWCFFGFEDVKFRHVIYNCLEIFVFGMSERQRAVKEAKMKETSKFVICSFVVS